MTDGVDENWVLDVGEAACGFRPVVGEPAQFAANLDRPFTTAFGEDAFPTVWEKAAALLHSFATTQTLLDGNKRTGWGTCLSYLLMHGEKVNLQALNPDAVESLVLRVAAGEMNIPDIVDYLKNL